MTDYEDYENNLAFPPTTDRTQSTIELVEKIEKLTKWLDLKSEYIGKLEVENAKLKKKLELAVNALKKVEGEPYPWYIAGTALEQIEELDE